MPSQQAAEVARSSQVETRRIPVPTVVTAGFGLGVAGDHLLRTESGPGLGFTLLLAGVALSFVVVTRQRGGTLSAEAKAWIAVGLVFGSMLLWRGSGLVRFGTFVAACTALAMPALHAGRAWVRSSGVLDLLEAVAAAGLHTVLGSLLLADRSRWIRTDADRLDTRSRTARAVLRSGGGGAILAALPLVIFGALFMSADPVFARLVSEWARVDLESLASHIAVTGLLTWLATGFLVGAALGTRADAVRPLVPGRPTLGIAQIGTALGLVDVLFLAFVVVQAGALFGGAAWVEATPGLTYAEYARSGFFQLVVAVALALPWLLIMHALVDERSVRARSVFRALAGLQITLLLAIVGSALQRMYAYQAAYGLTEDRIIATAVLIALGFVVLWFSATVLVGRREKFAFGALATAFALVATLQVIDPAGWAARHSLGKLQTAALPGSVEAVEPMDAIYLVSLGSDAVPLLVERINELPSAAQCDIALRLVRRWGPEQTADWRSYNRSEARARESVAAGVDRLQELSGQGCDGR